MIDPEQIPPEVEAYLKAGTGGIAHRIAAAEIDRLRAEVERWRQASIDWEKNATDLMSDCKALRADNERLRAALRQALGWIDNWDCAFKDDPEWRQYAPQIRAALAEEKKG